MRDSMDPESYALRHRKYMSLLVLASHIAIEEEIRQMNLNGLAKHLERHPDTVTVDDVAAQQRFEHYDREVKNHLASIKNLVHDLSNLEDMR